MIELKEIMNVNKQIVSQENKPIITIVQDTLLGINKLKRNIDLKYLTGSIDKIVTMNNTNSIYIKNTKAEEGKPKVKMVEGVYLNRKQMMNILCDLSTFGKKPFPLPKVEENVDGKNIKYYTGKQVFDFILPENLNLEMENGLCENNKDTKNYVKIVEGMLIQGGLDKGLFTKTSKGLIHTIFNDHGENRAKDFIDDLQKIVSYLLLIEGFSIGISDMIADNNTNKKINNIIKSKNKEIEEMMKELHLNIFENFTGETNNDIFENNVNSILNKTLSETGKLGLKNLEETNRAINMVNSGSKGKSTNIAQIIAC